MTDCESFVSAVLYSNYTSIAGHLLNPEFDPNQTIQKEHVLLYASRHKNVKLVSLLLENNRTIMPIVNNTITPMNLACRYDSVEIVELLLNDHRNTISYIYVFSQTCSFGAINIVKYFIENDWFGGKVDPNVRNARGETSLFMACQHRDVSIVKLLLQCPDIDPTIKNLSNQTILHATFGNTGYSYCSPAHMEIFKMIMEDGRVNPNDVDSEGESALKYACGLEKIDLLIIKIFLEDQRISTTTLNGGSVSALHTACTKNRSDIVKLFLEDHRIDPNVESFRGVTAFQRSCSDGRSDIVKLFLDSDRTDVNKRTKAGGKTGLHFACLHNYCLETVRILLDNDRIDPFVKCNMFLTPYDTAVQNDMSDITNYFKRVFPDIISAHTDED
jgi:ankyrin repeat protein